MISFVGADAGAITEQHVADVLGAGDVVLLAGKGHEQSIIHGTEKRPWDDRTAALDALAANAERNGVAAAVHAVRGDAFAVLKELREKLLPPLDDDFAGQLGDFDDLAALRADIQHRLERNALDRARHQFADRIIEYAIANATVDLPEVLVDQEVEVMHDEFRPGLARQGITEEVSTKNYDLLMLGTFKRSILSGSLFGGIGDYVMKNSKIPTAVFSIKGSEFPYRKILVPVCETLSTRASFALAMHLKQALGSNLVLADLRKYDKKKTHGFSTVFDRMGEMISTYGDNISVIRPSLSTSLLEEMELVIRDQRPALIVFGVRDGKSGKVRFNSNMKNLVKSTVQDIVVLKK